MSEDDDEPTDLTPAEWAEIDPDAPGLDEETRARRRTLVRLLRLSPEEAFELAVRAGIYTPDGKLTPPYRPDAEPSACRPTD